MGSSSAAVAHAYSSCEGAVCEVGLELPYGAREAKVREHVSKLWPGTLDAIMRLAEELNSQQGCVYAVLKERDLDDQPQVILSTPSLFVVTSVDRYKNNLTVQHVLPGDPSRHVSDRSKGIQCRVTWVKATGLKSPGLAPLLETLRQRSSNQAPSEQFWEFWAEFLDIERGNIEKAGSDPGWSYTKRRWGVDGSIDFFVGDDSEKIEARRGRLIVSPSTNSDDDRSSNLLFELRTSPARGWIAAAPVRDQLRLDQIPPQGRLKLDWLGLMSEFKRRKKALDKLRAGETALKGLNTLLPHGPRSESWGSEFVPILRSDYDLGQTKAIRSALVPYTVAAIMGPPGTGKTSVIAEVAAQVVRTGGRVLLSSQSNLAVDNALEKVANTEGVFAVRIGNPESVKLNRDLLLDNAGERYRQLLLTKSTAALKDERQRVRNLQCLYSEEEIEEAVDGYLEQIIAGVEHSVVDSSHASAASTYDDAAARLRAAEQAYSTLRDRLMLSDSELARTLQIAKKIQAKGWDLCDLSSSKAELVRIKSFSESLISAKELLERYEQEFKSMCGATSALHKAELRIERSIRAERELANAEKHNEQLEQRRRAASGWKWFKSKVFEWKKNTEELEQKIRNLDRLAAERDLPYLKGNVVAAHERAKQCFDGSLSRAEQIGISILSTAPYNPSVITTAYNSRLDPEVNEAALIISTLANSTIQRNEKRRAFRAHGWDKQRIEAYWPGTLEKHFEHAFLRLEQAEYLEQQNAMGLVPALGSTNEIEATQGTCASAKQAAAACKMALEAAADRLRAADARYQLSRMVEWRDTVHTIAAHFEEQNVKSGKTLADKLAELDRDVHDPLYINDAAHFCDRARTSLNGVTEEIRHRREERLQAMARFNKVADALSLYHARLQCAGLDLDESVLEEANVVAGTCSGIAGAKEFDREFDYVIVDEAGRATPLDLLMPIIKGRSIVLVGDHRQLPPTIDRELRQQLHNDGELKETLFQKLFDNMHLSRRSQLLYQYRMAPDICAIVKGLSYGDVDLRCGGEAERRKHSFGTRWAAVHWMQPVGDLNRAISEDGGTSLRNDAEVDAAVSALQEIAERISAVGRSSYSVGVISMYRAQVEALDRAIPLTLKEHSILKIETGTVDAFQGREKDAIIVSLVGTDPSRVSFFQDFRRINVALSRAKELLIIVGNIDVLGRRRRVGPMKNAVYDLNVLLQQAIRDGKATREVFNA